MTRRFFLLWLPFILLAAGCRSVDLPPERSAAPVAEQPAQAVEPPEALAGTRWRVAVLDGVAAHAAESTLTFVDGSRVSGNLGCNAFRGAYTADALGLRFESLATTRALCDRNTMQQEQRWEAVLRETRGLRFDEHGSMLLLDAAGSVRARLVRAP
jgi:heat shock protein HslJ